jgi:alkanesulfonate monooxygenase SsuD/methylene tetrahydromethanopterin reductase-like flavin-dependent oxidoreductase (luciferase family)
LLRSLVKDAGRDPAAFPLGKRVYVAVDADRARAGRRLAEWFGAFYGKPELAAQVSVWGDPAGCLDGLREIVAAGAEMLLLNPVFDEPAQYEVLASLGAKL